MCRTHMDTRTAPVTATVPLPDDVPSEATVRGLVNGLMAPLAALPDHRGRVYPLASLLAIHLLAAVGDGNSPEDAADFARDHAAWLRRLGLLGDRIPSAQTLRRLLRDRGPDLLAELQPLVATTTVLRAMTVPPCATLHMSSNDSIMDWYKKGGV